MDSRLETSCQSFLTNNLQTGNLGSLISVFLKKVNELLALSDQESNVHIWQAFNALFIIRSLVKYIVETGSEFQLLQHFEAVPIDKAATTNGNKAEGEAPSVDGSKFEAFLNAIINIIVVIPVK